MNIRTIMDPFGGNDTMVDKLIGPTAFRVVQYVALNMKAIQRAAAFARYRVVEVGVVADVVTTLAYPPKVKMQGLVRSDIWLIGEGSKINADSGAFTVGYTEEGVQITLQEGFSGWIGQKIEWFIEANEVP